MFSFIEKVIDNRKFKIIASLLTGITFFIGLILSFSQIVNLLKKEKDISGKWKIDNLIIESSLERYKGLKVGYTVVFMQNGNEIEGDGEKCWENGREIKYSERTPIWFKGKIKKNHLIFEIKEGGKMRTTIGTMILDLSKDLNSCNGKFNSTSANSQGTSIGQRID